MRERTDPGLAGGGFSVLDGIALVTGASVSSVHIRAIMRDDLNGFGWILFWGVFSWVAITAAGPFLFLVRRFVRRVADYPKVGDCLWAMMGTPWVVTAAFRSVSSDPTGQRDDLFKTVLTVGLAVVCLVALLVVWRKWVMVSPERAAQTSARPWTNQVGLLLSIAWPVQCGVGMVVIG